MPIIRQACVFFFPNLHVSGKPCILAIIRGVSRGILCFSWLGAGRQCPNNAPGCVPARLEMDSLTTAASKKQTFGYIIEADVSHPSTRKTAIASSLLCCGFVTLLNSDFEGKGINPFYISKTCPLVVCLNECFVFPLFAHEIK